MGQSLSAQKALNASAVFWFVVAFIGQLVFVAAIIDTYYVSAFQGDWAIWNQELTHGYEAGKTASNLASLSHILLAAVITFSGCLQLMPQIRKHFPTFHRWNGRFYLAVAVIMSLSGLFLIWTTGTVGDWTLHVGTSSAGVLILFFAFQAYRYARARDFASHRRWAIRLSLVVSAVWFFRVGLMLWFFVNQGPAGMDPNTFTGPFVTFLAYAQWGLPWLIAELYFKAQKSKTSSHKYILATSLSILTVLMGVGTTRATFGMWFGG